MLLGKNFDAIDTSTMTSLVEAEARESINLEFKRERYGMTDSDKREFLKDISALSNTLGGHLIIGIDESGGAASSIIPLAGIDVDQELLRLENIARTGIEPPVVGLRMKQISVAGGSVIAIQVPRSFNPPHRVISQNINRYYARNSAGTYELSLEELRMLFGRQRSIEERAKAFVGERFLRVQGGDGSFAIPLSQGALVMHLVPMPDLGVDRKIELATLTPMQHLLCPIGASGYSWRYNLDGLCIYRGGGVCHGYTQIFRNGTIEATSASMFSHPSESLMFGSLALPKKLFTPLSSYMNALRTLGATPPILLQISMMGISGLRMGVDPMRVIDAPPPYDREVLHLPASIIPDYREDGDYQAVIAEQMHFLWNTFGFERCFYFDQSDRWVGR